MNDSINVVSLVVKKIEPALLVFWNKNLVGNGTHVKDLNYFYHFAKHMTTKSTK